MSHGGDLHNRLGIKPLVIIAKEMKDKMASQNQNSPQATWKDLC